MIGQFNDLANWNRAAQLGVANYGQMTAGGWMYIGPQGIVHGTYSTLLNAGRSKLGIPEDQDLRGTLFVSSGLGGMSGAQGKAVEIAGGVGILAEVDKSRIDTRHSQGWVSVITNDPTVAFAKARAAQADKKALSIAFHGNIVELLEYAVEHEESIDLLSDQTSCHAVYDGGYCPVGITFEERTHLLANDKPRFRELVDAGLARHYQAIRTLTQRGTYFFDYGNSFMKAVYDSGIKDITRNRTNDLDGFIWPSYVEDIMGPMLFDFGYGPFRWVCLSGQDEDLRITDRTAMSCIDPDRRFQDRDNYNWIKDAEQNALVVGTKARILYQDAEGRLRIALAFNQLVREGKVGPIMLGRDHHDTGGTDSPFRETSNIKDGSNVMSEMATHVALGNAARGMSLVALHNGGGVGIGKVVNGGYGMVLDGSDRVDEILKTAMLFDVMGGVSRRAWARNPNAMITADEYNHSEHNSTITMPFLTNEERIRALVQDTIQKGGHQ
jgi:urocanate hydratase